MINLFHKKSYKKNRGAATLVITIILIVTSTLIIIFAANQGSLLDKITANQSRNNQAYQAAEAGLEFGINYLQQNSSLILANPVNGYIPSFSNSSTSNVSLANGSKYTITYTNPVANNYTLIKITSTGVSDDGTSTRVISEEVNFGSTLATPPTVPLITKGAAALSGNSQVINTINNKTIQSGNSVALSGNADTRISSGISSRAGDIDPDIQQNVSSIANMSQSDYFATYFGAQSSSVKNDIAHYYSNSSSTNYSSTLNGLTGTSIWIDQTSGTATINGNTTIGSATNPVLMIVNGDFTISGNVTIYGFIFVIGTGTTTTDITGNVTLNGGMVTAADFNMTGNTTITFSTSVLNNLRGQNSMSYYAKVPGTWKDF